MCTYSTHWLLRQLSSLTNRLTLNDENSPQYANTYRNITTIACTLKFLQSKGDILLNPNFFLTTRPSVERERESVAARVVLIGCGADGRQRRECDERRDHQQPHLGGWRWYHSGEVYGYSDSLVDQDWCLYQLKLLSMRRHHIFKLTYSMECFREVLVFCKIASKYVSKEYERLETIRGLQNYDKLRDKSGTPKNLPYRN